MHGQSKANQYLKRIKPFYSNLIAEGKMLDKSKESFFKDYLGYGKDYWTQLYKKNDLRKVFYVVVEFLEEVKELKEDKLKLEKQLNELLKNNTNLTKK